MRRIQIFILTGILIGTIILTNLPFLPGPNFLNAPAQLFYNGGQIFGMLGLLLVPFGIVWTVRQFRTTESKFKLAAILLWTIPLTVFLSTTYLSDFTRDYSRSFAIKRADKMIQEIEAYKKQNGQYPDSLEIAGIRTPSTGIIGIDNFYYHGDFDKFELTFYQNVILSFNYEIVTYDKTDNHSANGEMKELYETGFVHWKYEIFD
jgi:phosphotransferase system  glucose/maltose/N-acetylglucosamine-specific IIC component